MIVLGIETSCDETAAAVVRDGRETLSSEVYSQASRHAPFGGVVPDLAARCHVEALGGIIERAVAKADVAWSELDAVAATYGPGLSSSLLIGMAAAKGLAFRLDRPFIAVNHLQAHLYSPFMGAGRADFEQACPFVALIVSGGHTLLVHVSGLGRYRVLGRTLDDAAGEALDKAAMLLGLGYPGGPVIQRASEGGDAQRIRFPRARPRSGNPFLKGLRAECCFSFSGLKTALLYYMKEHPFANDSDRAERLPSIAASYQEAVVAALVDRCERALGPDATALACGGGVSLNARLRAALTDLARKKGVPLYLAEPAYCGDNAAMVAALAGAGQGRRGPEAMNLDANPVLDVSEF